jgi:putative transposase
MPRKPRLILPGFPHHVVQRGNRRQPVFFRPDDYRLFRSLLRRACAETGVACWAYCLMPNHVHLVLQPRDESGLATLMRQTQLAYTTHINRREDWSGFLWQGRYFSCPMDEAHALAALRYVELNPVKAGLCPSAEDWPWSSSRHHLGLEEDPMITTPGFVARIPGWRRYLDAGVDPETEARIGLFTRAGCPLGSDTWIAELEASTGRSLRPRRRGRPQKGDRWN